MKNPLLTPARFTLCLLTLLGASLPSQVRAQATAPAPSGERRQMLAQFTPEEKQKLKAAHDAALRDPSVVALSGERETNRAAYRQAVRAAMLRVDPSVGSLLERMRPAGAGGQQHQGQARMQQRLSVLSPEERTQFRAARRAARNDPAVASARQAMQSAATAEARRQAHHAVGEAMRNAMLKNDPSVAPILAKLRQQPRQGQDDGELNEF